MQAWAEYIVVTFSFMIMLISQDINFKFNVKGMLLCRLNNEASDLDENDGHMSTHSGNLIRPTAIPVQG